MTKGIRVNGKTLMLDFSYNEKRYRLTTNLSNIPPNYPIAEKLLATLKLDLERSQFFVANYKKQIKNLKPLEQFDPYISKQKNSIAIDDLIIEQLEKYKQRTDLTYASLVNLEGVIKLHLLPYFTGYDATTITATDIEEFVGQLKNCGKQRIRLILRPLKLVMKEAERKGLIKSDPFKEVNIAIYKQNAIKSKYKRKPCSLTEIQAILDNCSHDCVRNIIQFGFWTGCRIGEMFALEWGDIDFENETIDINKSASINRIIKSPKSDAGYRVIEMTPKAKDALQKQFQITGKSGKRVFVSPQGKNWIKTDSLGRFWKNALEKAGVEHRNPYQMRHTFISYMLSIGNSPLILYRIVGHENPGIIYKHYARYIDQGTGRKLLITE